MVQKSKSNAVFDFTRNVKQQAFFEQVMLAVAGKSLNRYFFYGGAIRGGKTAVCIATLYILAKKYPNSRWHIIRDSFTTLEGTTIPSFEKFFPSGSKSIKRYSRNPSNYFVEFVNGSKIFFVSESLNHDKDLTWMLGLETNGIMLEQVESLSEKCWEKALERCGSWYIDPMPPGLILATFNPTLTWIKAKIYDKYAKGELKSPYFYINALPSDNPMVTEDQWNAWKQMDEVSYARFVEGDWSAFAVDKPFLYSFKYGKHVSRENYIPNPHLNIIISFDFNKDPMTCSIGQKLDIRTLVVFDTIKLPNSSTPELCDQILVRYPQFKFKIDVTGDSTGANRSPLVVGDINHYIIIKAKLSLSDHNLKVQTKNKDLDASRLLCNSILQNADVTVTENCLGLINDLTSTQVDNEGKIVKTKENGRHEFDNFRYMLEACFPDFLDKPHLYAKK